MVDGVAIGLYMEGEGEEEGEGGGRDDKGIVRRDSSWLIHNSAK